MKVYCDGAASDNGNKNKRIGGWAYVVVSKEGEIAHSDSGARFSMTITGENQSV